MTMAVCATIGVIAVQMSAVVPAAASTSVSLTKDVTVGSPPSGSFAGASSGDGWDVLFFGGSIYNIFHHGAQFILDCHSQTDGSHCDTVSGISPWPKTVSSPEPVSEFTTPAHSSGWVDQSTGRLYGWTSRVSDATGGIVCVDLTTSAADPYCGFTALTAAGANPETNTAALGGRAMVGTEMFAYDVSTRQVLCFSTVTDAACAGQPFNLDIGGISPATGSFTDDSTLGAGGKLFVHVDDNATTGGVLTCFDPATNATCSGSWPQLVADAYPGAASQVGAPFPYFSTSGAVIRACLP